MASQLENSVRRKCGYIVALKSRSDGEGLVEDLKFLERICLEDLEKGTRLLLMMKETKMKIGEKITYVGSLGNDAMSSSLPLIRELARAAESDVTKDQLVFLFEREIAESVGKIKEYRRLCIELRANMRLRNDYISELWLYRSCDNVLGSIAMLRTIQSDDSKNAARLLSLARETQRKVDEKTAFIRRIRERTPRTAL
ncbi:hypothetical protein Tco_0736912 [Tanacetum coccineum]